MINEEVLNTARDIIAGFIKQRREELKLTQQQVADISGLGLRTVQRAEEGKFWLGMKQFLQLCHALELYPAIAEKESNTDIAAALRANWQTHPKAEKIFDLNLNLAQRDGWLNRHTHPLPATSMLIKVMVHNTDGEHIHICRWEPKRHPPAFAGTATDLERQIGFNAHKYSNQEFVYYQLIDTNL